MPSLDSTPPNSVPILILLAVASLVSTRIFWVEETETMLAVTPVALAPVLGALMGSRRSVSLSVASTLMVLLPMLKLPENAAWPLAVPRSVVRLVKLRLPILWEVAIRLISTVWGPIAAALVTVTPSRLPAWDGMALSVRLGEAKTDLPLNTLSTSP